jgi:hypothetical protein
MSANGALPPLTRDELLALDDRPVRTFFVPEWGRDVYIRAPALPDLIGLMDRAKGLTDPVVQARELLLLGLVTADGTPCLTAEDAAVLVASRHMGALQRIAQRLGELCGIEGGQSAEGK